jgi:hypothetical protein
MIRKLWPAALLLAGCASVGPTGGHRRDVPILTTLPYLGLRQSAARAVIVVPAEERAYKDYAPIPGGAFDFRWGENLGAAAESAFSQAFRAVGVSDLPDPSADYQIRLSVDREKTRSHIGFSSAQASLAIVVSLFERGTPVWTRTAFSSAQTNGNTSEMPRLGTLLAATMKEAAKAVDETVSRRTPAAPAAAAPAAEPVASARPAPEPAAARSDVDELPAARAPRPHAHAIVIGIERYREKLPAADFAAGDARTFARYAHRVLGVPEENLAVLTDDHATRGDFEKYFERWLPNRVEKGDEVFVYYSGHGAPDPKTGDAFLVPYDADPTYIQETGYPLKKLYAELSKLPAKRIVLALDSCFSGAGGRSVIAKGARPLVSARAADAPANVTVLAASGADEISNSYEAMGHGLFTYFLLKGLKLSGDLDAAFDFAAPQVAKVARRDLNADQRPVRRGR